MQTPSEFDDLARAFSKSVAVSTRRLAGRLEQVAADHGLTRAELLSAQRHVTELCRIDAAPSTSEYWQRTALPRASALTHAAMGAVVQEGDVVGDALDRYLVALDGPPLKEWADSDPGRAASEHEANQATVQLLAAVPNSHAIDSLGSWWQRRLRRAAMGSIVTRLLTAGDTAEAMVAERELQLLDSAPWSHGDRLLAAFELAHREILTQTELVVDGLNMRASRRWSPNTNRPQFTIELRH